MKSIFTWCGSFLWSTASIVNHAFEKKGEDLGCRVVSVGNIQAGGAGKTPLVAALARAVISNGDVPVILTRGYLGTRELTCGVLPPSRLGEYESLDPDEWGDEPVLLKSLVPDAWIGVGAKRAHVFRSLLLPRLASELQLPVEQTLRRVVVILDDGFQHRKVRRSVDVVALTSTSRSERLFREFSSALKRADVLVWTKGEQCPVAEGDSRLVIARFRVPTPDARFSKKQWWFVSGIGEPTSALKAIQEAGWKVAKSVVFRDHARYQPALIQSIRSDAEQAGCGVLISGKDAVKWQALGAQPGDDLQVVEPIVEFSRGSELWSQILLSK